jgi:hypothetical protein
VRRQNLTNAQQLTEALSLIFKQGRKFMTGGNKTIMKRYIYRSRKAFILMAMCALFLSEYAASQAMGSEAQSRRVAVTRSAFAQTVKDPGRLIIRRIPNLGYNVIVDLYVDGDPVAPILYGHTYEGVLPAGRHVLSVLPTPAPKWRTPWQMITLDVRNGQTYTFTAMGDGSGHLILKSG